MGNFKTSSLWWLLNRRDTADVYTGFGKHYDHKMLELGAGYYGFVLGKYFEVEGGYSHGKSKAFEEVSSYSEIPRSSYPSRMIYGIYDRADFQLGGTFARPGDGSWSTIIRVSCLKFSRIESQSAIFVFDKKKYFSTSNRQ